MDTDTLAGISDPGPDGDLTAALRWLADTVETESLLAEARDASARISVLLVGAAREYSQPDRGGQAPVDLQRGLESTLVMLTRKIGDHVEPFFSTKPTGSGTGLGLDLSRRIVVNRHGGELRVTSAPGDTRFQTRLPLSPARSEGDPS